VGNRLSVKSIGRTVLIFALCVVLCLPALAPIVESRQILLTVGLLIVFFALSVPHSLDEKNVASLIFGAAASMLVIKVFFDSGPSENYWIISLPATIVLCRPYMGSAVLLIAMSTIYFINGGLGHAIIAVIVAVTSAYLGQVAAKKIISILVDPVQDIWRLIYRLTAIFIVAYFSSSTWFSIGHWAIQNADKSAYTISGDSTLEVIDFILFSFTLNASGEPIFVSPISIWARSWTLFEIVYSYAFSAIYFAIVVTKLLETIDLKREDVL